MRSFNDKNIFWKKKYFKYMQKENKYPLKLYIRVSEYCHLRRNSDPVLR